MKFIAADKSRERFRRSGNKLYRIGSPIMLDNTELNSHFIESEDGDWLYCSFMDGTEPLVAFAKSMVVL